MSKSEKEIIRDFQAKKMRAYRSRVKDRGLIQINVTIPAECRDQVKEYCAKLRRKFSK